MILMSLCLYNTRVIMNYKAEGVPLMVCVRIMVHLPLLEDAAGVKSHKTETIVSSG